MTEDPLLGAAVCVDHSEVQAVATCTRCGRFACGTCLRVAEPPVCTTCSVKLLDPFALHGRTFTVLSAISIGLRLLWAELVSVVALALATAIAETSFASFVQHQALSVLFNLTLGTLAGQAAIALFIARAEGRHLELGQAIVVSSKSWVRALGGHLRSTISIMVGMFLFLVPGLIAAARLSFVQIAVLRASTQDTLASSRAIVEGRTWQVLGFLVLRSSIDLSLVLLLVVAARFAAGVFPLPFWFVALAFNIGVNLGTAAGSAINLVAFVSLHHDANLPLEPMRWATQPPLASEQTS